MLMLNFVSKKTDGAYLIAVESINEHMFIQKYLSQNDIEQRMWYTSGQEIASRWVWSSTDAVFSYDKGFLPPVVTDVGSYLVYAYRRKYFLLEIFSSI